MYRAKKNMSKTMTQTVSAPQPKVAGSGASAVPDSNTLLAYKLLQESWKALITYCTMK